MEIQQRVTATKFKEQASDAVLAPLYASLEPFYNYLSKANLEVQSHQCEGLQWCMHMETVGFPLSPTVSCKSGIVADDMGLGKTTLMLGLIASRQLEHTLIVVPLPLLAQWKKSIEETLPMKLLVFHGSRRSRSARSPCRAAQPVPFFSPPRWLLLRRHHRLVPARPSPFLAACSSVAVVLVPYSLCCFCAVTLPLISMSHCIAVSHRTAPMAVGSRVMFVAGVARAADSLVLAPLSSLVSSRRLGGLCVLPRWCGCSSFLRLAVWAFCLVSIQFSREPTSLWAAI